MKAILEFNLPDDQADFDKASRASDYFWALCEIEMDIFRPARKHGYSDARLKEMFEQNEEFSCELVGLLEDKFRSILNEREINTP